MRKAENLLQSAANEIKSLRQQNALMSARLDMFDNLMLVFHTPPAYGNTGMSPDIVSEMENFIKESEKQ